jgi:predicted nucleic acid-binding protein
MDQARKGFAIFDSIPIQYVKTDFINTMAISKQTNMYAYDAYFLDCAVRRKAPLLTLDRKLKGSRKNKHLHLTCLFIRILRCDNARILQYAPIVAP